MTALSPDVPGQLSETVKGQPVDPFAEDRKYMGTPEEAKTALILKAHAWRELRQPRIDTAAGHRRIEAREREAQFQLANATLLWLWHEEHPAAPVAP